MPGSSSSAGAIARTSGDHRQLEFTALIGEVPDAARGAAQRQFGPCVLGIDGGVWTQTLATAGQVHQWAATQPLAQVDGRGDDDCLEDVDRSDPREFRAVPCGDERPQAFTGTARERLRSGLAAQDLACGADGVQGVGLRPILRRSRGGEIEFDDELAPGRKRRRQASAVAHLGGGSEPGVVISELTERGIRCVILTSELRPIPIRRAVAAGAVGLIIKSDPPEKVVDVLTQVANEKFAVSSDLAFTFVNDPNVCARLSPREVEVLQLLTEGHIRRGVARSFDPPLSESTVATYLERILLPYRALGRQVRNTVDAVREATVDGYFGANGEL